MSFSGLMYLCGFVCLILAPFTGLTVVGAAAFFVIRTTRKMMRMVCW
jgi:hypothetical protein